MKLTRRNALTAIGMGAVTATGLSALSLPGIARAEDLSDLMEPGPLGEHIVGNPEAPVTIIEYASMTCPHCRTWHKEVYPVIKEKYIDT
ncbi:MAG: thioredoxin domain-containing protein, partial [Pseudomonadota bacterium]